MVIRILLMFPIIMILSCAKNIKNYESALFLELKNSNLWLDLMPKFDNSPSLLHFELEYNLSNYSKEEITIDSIKYELINGDSIIFNFSQKNYNVKIHPESKEFITIKFNVPGVPELQGSRQKIFRIFVILFYRIDHHTLNTRILVGEKELEIVY